MPGKKKIDDRFTVGLGHPAQDELKQLADQGYKAVVNLRHSEEDGQPLQPDEEGAAVRRLGMEYRHIPVVAEKIDDALVDDFRRTVEGLPGPIYVHCASGQRSGAFTMMHKAAKSGMSGDETLQHAEAMGFECKSKDLADFVRSYVDRQDR